MKKQPNIVLESMLLEEFVLLLFNTWSHEIKSIPIDKLAKIRKVILEHLSITEDRSTSFMVVSKYTLAAMIYASHRWLSRRTIFNGSASYDILERIPDTELPSDFDYNRYPAEMRHPELWAKVIKALYEEDEK